MPYTYDRMITINDADFTMQISTCAFSHADPGGCNTANLVLPGLMFDDFGGVGFGDVVKIYHSRTRTYDDNGVWTPTLDTPQDIRWQGHVVNLSTSLEGGLTVECNGFALTYLKEWNASGKYGTVAVIIPLTNLAAVPDYTLGNLGKGDHKYYVFAGDSLGFKYDAAVKTVTSTLTEAGSPAAMPPTRLTLSWSDVPLATRYRVYKAFTAAMITAPVGAGNDNAAAYTRYYYIDVVENRFVDDGMFPWTDRQYVGTIPTVDTCTPLSAVGTKISDVVKAVLGSRVPALYDEALITGGTEVDATSLNYDSPKVSIYEMLETLANLVGDITWGVNADGKVYFKTKPTLFDTEEDVEAAILMTKTVGGQISPEDMASVDVFDIMLVPTRSARRDGITEIIALLGWSAKVSLVGSILAGRQTVTGRSSLGFTVTETYGTYDASTQDGTAITTISTDPVAVFGTPENPLYTDVDAFEGVHPGLSWLYRLWLLEGASARVIRVLQTISTLMQANAQSPQQGPRARGITVVPAGVGSEVESSVYASNIMRDVGSTGGTWSIPLTRVETEIIPGEKLFAVIAMNGTRYVVEIRSVDYMYEDDAVATITCGELDPYELAMRQQVRVQRALATPTTPDEAIPGIGNPVVMSTRGLLESGAVSESALYPSEVTLGRNRIGTSAIPTPIDHEHSLPVDAINTAVAKDGETFPNVGRTFTAADLAALEAKTSTERGLKYKEGDLAHLDSDPTKRTRIYQDGAWVPICARMHCVVFPAIPAAITDIELGKMYWHAGPGDAVWTLDSFVFTAATGVVGTDEAGDTP